jgi:hypothetical protein
MEEVQDSMRKNQKSKMLLRDARAMELMGKKPQLAIYDNELEPTLSGAGAGGEAGLNRVVGAGKRRARKAKGGEMPEPASPPSETEGVADKEGREFAKHIRKLKGKKFLDAFHRGLMAAADGDSDVEMEGGALVPGGVAARTTGNPPQAPASFTRNSVSLDREAPTLAGAGNLTIHHEAPTLAGAGNLTIHHEGAAKPKTKRAPSARGAAISKMMKEHGVSLGEASKMLKKMS